MKNFQSNKYYQSITKAQLQDLKLDDLKEILKSINKPYSNRNKDE